MTPRGARSVTHVRSARAGPCYRLYMICGRAMLLCAGHGTRLSPLTDHLPKPLVPVCNRPLVLYNLILLRDAGVREVMVNLHHLGDLIPEVLGDGSDLGLRLLYNHEPTLLGTGGGLLAVREFLGSGTCLVANGDSLVDADLASAIERHRDSGALATMLLHPHERPEAFGAVRVGGAGEVVGIDHVSRRPGAGEEGAFVFSGVQVLEPAFFDLLEPGPSCVVRTAWRRIIDGGLAGRGDPCVRSLHDCGTPGRLLAASRELLRDPTAFGHLPRPRHHPPAGEGAGVRGPVLFGPGVVLGRGATVGPEVVLGAHVRVAEGVSMRDAVVWPGVEVAEATEGAVLS